MSRKNSGGSTKTAQAQSAPAALAPAAPPAGPAATPASTPQTAPAAQPATESEASPFGINIGDAITRSLASQLLAPQEATPVPEEAQAPEPSAEAPPETPAESPTDPPAPESASDEPGAEEEGEPKPRGTDKRIERLTAQKHELREELETVRAQLAALQEQLAEKPATPHNPLPDRPAPEHPALKQLDDQISEVEAILTWAEEHPEGGEIANSKGEMVSISAEDVRKARALHNPKYGRLIARREALALEVERETRAAAAKAHAEAEKAFPWMRDRKSPEFVQATEIIRRVPHLLHVPDHELLLGWMIEGRKAIESRQQAAAAKPAPAQEPRLAPRAPVLTGNPLVNRPVPDPVSAARRKVVASGGSEQAVADYLGAILPSVKVAA